MPIEFPCTQCGKLLRTPDGTAGKQAKCPQCGAVLPIPPSTPTAEAPAPAPSAPFVPPPPATRPLDPSNPFRSPAGMEPVVEAGTVQRAFNPTPIDLGDVLSKTWTIYKSRLGQLIGIGLLVLFLSLIVPIGIALLLGDAQQPIPAIANLVQQLYSLWLNLGVCAYMLKVGRGEQAEVGDLFGGGALLPRAIGVGILFMICYLLGFILCIIPGIIIGLMFSQVLFVLVDQRTGVIDTFKYSIAATSGNKLTLLALYLVVAFAALLFCLVTLGIGLVFAYPFGILLAAVTYLSMTGQTTADRLEQFPAA